jgi:hypothetical protein
LTRIRRFLVRGSGCRGFSDIVGEALETFFVENC